jgi:hypothetical protein
MEVWAELVLSIVVPANRVDAHFGRSSSVCPDDVRPTQQNARQTHGMCWPVV